MLLLSLEKTAKADGSILVDVVLEFPNGDRNLTQLSLLKYVVFFLIFLDNDNDFV